MTDPESQGSSASDDQPEHLDVALKRLEEGQPVFGERLLVLGSGPLPALAAEGTMALDERGSVVLLIAMTAASTDNSPLIANELEDIATLTAEDISQLAGESNVDALVTRHTEFFSDRRPGSTSLNGTQRAILLLEEEPSVDTWDGLIAGLGARLSGVYVVEKDATLSVTPTETTVVEDQATTRYEEPAAQAPPVDSAPAITTYDEPTSLTETIPVEEEPHVWPDTEAPEALQFPSPQAPPKVAAPRRDPADSRAGSWVWLAVIAVGVGLAVWGLTRTFFGPDEPATPTDSTDVVQSAVREVATGTGPEATHTQWIGQQHFLRASNGSLLTLYTGPEGLYIVRDKANQGRGWRQPRLIEGIDTDSFSAAIDSRDRIHLAFHTGTDVSYAIITKDGKRWTSSAVLELDPDSSSPVVDVAWDEDAGVAHVVWAKVTTEGQQPYWASVDADGEQPVLADQAALADAGETLPVLATVDVGPDSNVLATYRRGDRIRGWYSRSATRAETTESDAGYLWAEEERVPTKEGIGASAVAIDGRGTAHIVLRDSTSFQLVYFRKPLNRAWSRSQTILDTDSTEEMDMPTITLDESSRLIYVFFETNRSQVEHEVQVAVRDPATGWQQPVPIVDAAEIPEGARFPTSLGTTTGEPIVLWTKGGPLPAIQAAPVNTP
jgi:hypothetical protein